MNECFFAATRPQFLGHGKPTLQHDPCNLIMLDAFDLGVLGELGELCALCASLFPGPKWVRAKDTKLAKG